MKKITLLLIALVLMFSFVACETDNNDTVIPVAPTGPLDVASTVLSAISKPDRFEDGTYKIDISYVTDSKEIHYQKAYSYTMNGNFYLKETVKDFSLLMAYPVSNDGMAGIYVKDNDLYLAEPVRGGEGEFTGEMETIKVSVDSFSSTIDEMKVMLSPIDVKAIINSCKTTSFIQHKDGSYEYIFDCDVSKDLSFLENIDQDLTTSIVNDQNLIEEVDVPFNTTVCKVTLKISEDFHITKITIEFSQTAAQHIEMTYTCKYEMSFIGSDNTIAPPEGMDIENAETME